MVSARVSACLHAYFRREELAGTLLVAMPAIALVPKLVLILHTLGTSGAEIFDTGFGVGGYVRGLLSDGSFRSCGATPYLSCDPSLCVHATRMPLLPMLYAGLAKILGTKSAPIAIAKCVLTASLLTAFLWSLTRVVRFPALAVLLAYALYLGPQVLKHGASLEYEEGLLVELEVCLGIAAAYLISPDFCVERSMRTGLRTRTRTRTRTRMALATIALATTLYFVKTTALPMLLVIIALVLSDRQLQVRSKGLAMLVVVIPFAAWAAHNYTTSGALHLSSSWNGENLYRGSSSEGLALYPEISLDRIFDSTHATLSDGRVVLLPDLTERQCFVNEWAWNDHYSSLARTWSQEHMADAARFLGKKLWVSLVELRHTPTRVAAEGQETEYPRAVSTVMFLWMGFARVMSLVLLALLLRDVWQRRLRRSLWTLALLGAGWAPYVLVFAYQRHVVPLLVTAGFFLLILYFGRPRERAGTCPVFRVDGARKI